MSAMSTDVSHAIRKYVRTPHLEGSRLQPGDDDIAQVRFAELVGKDVVVEEKVDGQNAALSFDVDGRLLLQSRGHYLRGGPRERSFELFKRWAACHEARLREVLQDRYIVYGEWCWAKHTCFYDALPHYFLAFDVFDRARAVFLDTPARRDLLRPLPIVEAPVLGAGRFAALDDVLALLGPSTCKSSDWRGALRVAAGAASYVDVERTVRETDPDDRMEGLYLKVEEDGVVVDRCKWVRASFHQVVKDADSHWFGRPLVPNGLRAGVDLFAQSTP